MVAASSTEAEYIATAFAAKEAIWLRQLLREIEYFIDPRETERTPSHSAIWRQPRIDFLTKNPENHQRTKHIDVQYHFTRARVESNEIAVEYIPTADMTADILTKSLEWVKHERHMRGMGLVDQRGSLVLFLHRPIFPNRVFWAVVRFNEARRGTHVEEELWQPPISRRGGVL
jgi:hypothetical protein